ncbi:MAG: hypothetical protein ACJ746_20220 [Bryobacteraceae bacterium]
MPALSSALVVPDSLLAKEATEILREHSSDLLFDLSFSKTRSASEFREYGARSLWMH